MHPCSSRHVLVSFAAVNEILQVYVQINCSDGTKRYYM